MRFGFLAGIVHLFAAGGSFFVLLAPLGVALVALLAVFLVFVGLLFAMRLRAAKAERGRQKLSRQILAAASAYPPDIAAPPERDVLFGRVGLSVLSDMLDAGDDATVRILCNYAERKGFSAYALETTASAPPEQISLIIRLIGRMQLKNLAPRVTALLYRYQERLDIQYDALLTLAETGSFEQISKVCLDKGLTKELSYRSLMEVLNAYTGDKEELFGVLLASQDAYVVRVCVKCVGNAGYTALAPRIAEMLDADDNNLCVDAARTTGQLGYVQGMPRLAELLSHERWEVRVISTRALALLDADGKYAGLIENALHDSEWDVRCAAAAAIAEKPDADEVRARVAETKDHYALEVLDFMIAKKRGWEVA